MYEFVSRHRVYKVPPQKKKKKPAMSEPHKEINPGNMKKK